jgi:hypothetical protein
MRDHRPAHALGVYLRLFEPLKRSTGDQAYHEVARLLRSIRACHERLGTPEEFSRRLAALRAELKRRPKLMKILDKNDVIPSRPAHAPPLPLISAPRRSRRTAARGRGAVEALAQESGRPGRLATHDRRTPLIERLSHADGCGRSWRPGC